MSKTSYILTYFGKPAAVINADVLLDILHIAEAYDVDKYKTEKRISD